MPVLCLEEVGLLYIFFHFLKLSGEEMVKVVLWVIIGALLGQSCNHIPGSLT